MTIKLNDLQRVLLSKASQNDDGRVSDTGLDPSKAKQALSGLVRRQLLEKYEHEAGAAQAYRITNAGLAAIGIEEPTEAAAGTPSGVAAAPKTKIATVITLLNRAEGATLDQMIAATGWLPHTTRAALTGLRRRGHAVMRTATDDGSVYRIGAAA